MVIVESKESAGYLCDIYSNGHILTADEPYDFGGLDFGPNPYDFLCISLGSCTAMTLRSYARIKKFEIDLIRVFVKHEKVKDEEMTKKKQNKGMRDVFLREIEIYGKITQKQRSRMLEIADRCPVHRTFHSKIEVNTELKEI